MNKSVVTIALVLSLPACAHLDQAPLVYSSRTALGVDVTAGAAESPGVAMTVGYKQVDAAYVPVAVARTCRDAASEHCAKDAYGLHVIGGSSEDGSVPGGRDAATEAAVAEAAAFAELYEQSVDKASAARTQQRAAQVAADALRVQVEQLAGRQRQFEQRATELAELQAREATLAATPTPGDEGELATIRARIGEIEALQLDATEQADLQALEGKLTAANDDLAKANADLAAKEAEVRRRGAELAQKRDVVNQFNKNDSYSVFGSFEARTRGAANEANVGIGQVFATGVASQNVSSGLANMYRTRDVTACYEAVAKSAITDADKLDKLLAGCRSR